MCMCKLWFRMAPLIPVPVPVPVQGATINYLFPSDILYRYEYCRCIDFWICWNQERIEGTCSDRINDNACTGAILKHICNLHIHIPYILIVQMCAPKTEHFTVVTTLMTFLHRLIVVHYRLSYRVFFTVQEQI